jgi:DNA helicase-2/ATP-dependent DNA helicase PcrA
MGDMKLAEANAKRRSKLLVKVSSQLLKLRTSRDCAEIRRLTLEQLDFIHHRLSVPCYLAACPGSGKTEVVGIKAAYEFSKWPNPFCGIAILTFTKHAAGEIRERVVKYGGVGAMRHPHFIGTFDSWLHNYIFQPFGHAYTGYTGRCGDRNIRIIDNDSSADFLLGFRTKALVYERPANADRISPDSDEDSDISEEIAQRPVCANQFSYDEDGNPDTSDRKLVGIVGAPRNRQELDRCKDKFWKAGFATYRDAEFISLRILSNRKSLARLVAKRFPFIIVDECQDLSPAELMLLEQLQGEGVVVHLVGDLDQAIYEFRKVRPELVCGFSARYRLIRKELTANFRSNQEIVEVCRRIIGKQEEIIGTGSGILTHTCVLYEYVNLAAADLPGKFRTLIERLGFNPIKCAVLARGKSTLKKIAPQCDSARKPIELYAAALNSYYGTSRSRTDDLANALEQIGKAVSYLAYNGRGNHQQQYCPDEMDPIRWRATLWDLLRRSAPLYPFEKSGVSLTWSKWAVSLKGFLQGVWATLPVSPVAWNLVESRVKAPRGMASKGVSVTLHHAPNLARVRTTTIHDAKGETLDAIVLVSSPDERSPGGHYEHWIHAGPENAEHRRFAYVACSRPKHLLIIAAKKERQEDKQLSKQKLLDLGFVNLTDLAEIMKKGDGLDGNPPKRIDTRSLILRENQNGQFLLSFPSNEFWQ